MKPIRDGCLFGIGWTVANSIGWAIVLGIFFWFSINPPIMVQETSMGATKIGNVLTYRRLWAIGFAIFGGVVCGTIIGIVQWIFLRHWNQTKWHILANIIGWGAGLGVAEILGFYPVEQLLSLKSFGLFENNPFVTFGLTLALSGGVSAGLAEWFVMRRDMKKIGYWILAKSIGWMIAWSISFPRIFIIGYAILAFWGFPNGPYLNILVVFPLVGIVSGVIIGFVGGFIESFGLTLSRLNSNPTSPTKST